jgi:hypothetical protein
MLEKISGVSSPNKNNKKVILIYVHKNSVFVQSQSFRFLSMGTIKIPVYSATFENKQTLNQCIFYAYQTIHNCPGIF